MNLSDPNGNAIPLIPFVIGFITGYGAVETANEGYETYQEVQSGQKTATEAVVETAQNVAIDMTLGKAKVLGDAASRMVRSAPDKPGGSATARVAAKSGRFLSVSPTEINFSQRTINGSKIGEYIEKMKNGEWDWEQSRICVMKREGQLVSYDNRRLHAAREAGLEEIPIEIVQPNEVMPGSKKTWEQAFQRRFRDERNRDAGGVVPEKGLHDLPQIVE